MNKLIIDDISKYYLSLDDARDDGYVIVKTWSLTQFYKLKGRTSNLIAENFEPILYVEYVVFSPQEKRYYLKTFRGIPLVDLFFYKNRLYFDREDIAIETLRRYVFDSNVWLLLKSEQFSDIKNMLARVYKSQRADEGTLKYKDFITLVELSLKLEYWDRNKRNESDFKTQQHILETQIREIWLNANKIKI